MSDKYDKEDQPCLTYGEAWEIQRTVGSLLNHHSKCSSVPGHHPLSGPALLCDCGVIERLWNHRRFVKLERELAEVTKQRDILMTAMEEIGGGAHSWKTCVDQLAPRAIAEATGQTYDEVVKNLTGLEGGAA